MIDSLKVSQAFVAALCRVEPSKLSLALRRLRPFGTEEGQDVVATLSRLVELRDALLPLQPDLRDPDNARLLLKATEGLDAEEIAERIQRIFQD
jgi:hypothetical protein